MSTSAPETVSVTPANPATTSEQRTQSSNRGKRPSRPRKQFHDRLKPHTDSSTQLNKASRTPRKPPGLSTPPEAVSEPETRPEADDSDGELCFICGNSMKGRYYSLSPCNNAFCHNCSLRLRALYKSTNCPFCKTEHETVIFAESNERPFTEFQEDEFQHKDAKLGILFETEQIWEDSMLLLRFNCPDPSCDVACRNWSALKAHVKTAHHRYLCSLCTQHKKVFTHEHILYTSRELTTHFATGDPIKDISLTGFTGHPKCKFCNQSFYSLDEFTQHNREKHERCHVCDRINSHSGLPDAQPRYFVNYDELWRHFQTEHYPCGAPECLEQKFVVFESDIDLKAHIMDVHMGRATKAELRDMRRVEVNFQYNTPAGGSGRRRREEERPARDVDISTLPRDEQAYYRIQQAQREMASRQIGNVSIPPVRPRGAGEAFPPLAANSAAPAAESSTAPVRRPVDNFPPLGETRSAPTTAAPTPPPPTSRLPPEVAARHAAVLTKAAQLLNNDPEKISQFKSQVSFFRRSDSTATELIDRLWDIFNAPRDEFGKLITSTADLFDYDAKDKRTELLGAWNDWKVQVVQFANFIDSQMQAADSAASSGFLPQPSQRSRILLLKSSAKGRPSASTQSAQSVWNRIEAVAASRPVPSASVSQRLGAMHLNPTTRPAVPWTGASTPAPRPSPVVAPSQPQRVIRNTVDDFPSLPAAKPREKVTLNAAAIPARPVMGWGVPAASSTNVTETTEVAKGKGKGKKKGKTILFHTG